MPKETHFYDTINGIRNYDTASNNYNYHSFNVTFPLRLPIINLKSITLKSVEMPINLTTARTANSSSTFFIKFTYSGSPYQILVDINISNYDSISSLLNAITEKIDLATSFLNSVGFFVSVYPIPIEQGFYCMFDHNCTIIEIEDTPLTRNILGFTIFTYTIDGIDFLGQSPINLNAQSPVNLNTIDSCVYIKVINLPVMNNNNIDGYTFKVPLNNIVNGTVYFNDTLDHQTIYFNKSNFVLNKFDIVVVDRLGAQLTGYYNWTFSLIIDYSENNNNEPQFLNINN